MGLDLPAEAIWDLTLREVDLHMRVASERRQHQNDELVRLAWQTAAFTRAKKLPSLESVIEAQKPRPRQTWQQQAALLANW